MHLFSPEAIAAGGLILIAFIVFAESGLLFGFFLPGDTLLFLAGILAAQGKFNIIVTLFVIAVSAILGGETGYYIGKKFGPKLFKKKDGILFKHEYIERSEQFYEKHGGKTIILARFVPIVRTFAPVVAGIGNMNIRAFSFYNIVGSLIWAISVTLIGYFFGSKIGNIEKYVLPIIGLVMLVSFGSPIFHILRDSRSRQLLIAKFSNKKLK